MAKDLSRNEAIKEASAYLRGTLAEGVADEIMTDGIIFIHFIYLRIQQRSIPTFAFY